MEPMRHPLRRGRPRPDTVRPPGVGRVLGLALGLFVSCLAQAAPAAVDEVELGRRIYTEGTLASGAALTGVRPGSSAVSGAAVACVNCHRQSGMGQVEADVQVPPITGNYLFAARGDMPVASMDPRISKQFNRAHDPYTDVALSAAIRDGLNNRGMTMSGFMPRYPLGERDLHALTAYLKQLSAHWSPGVTQSAIRLATVITPDVDPARRKVFIDMLRAIVRQKNSSTVTAAQGRTRRHMTTAAEMILGTERNWELDIWELQGPPASWDAQLTERYRANPVFALVSGLSDGAWQPVQDFCEREAVPCWFPSVELPGRGPSNYAFYFSGGVGLEASVLAQHLKAQAKRPERVVQIHRDTEVGRAAAQALVDALADSAIPVVDRTLPPGAPAVGALQQALSVVVKGDVAIFWLAGSDIDALATIPPAPVDSYFSALMAGGEHTLLAPSWRAHAHMPYLYELPAKRKKNLDHFHAWLSIAKVPLIDEPMQSEVYFALNFMTDTLSEMLDNVYRDYLVERGETMLTKREGMKAAQETRNRVLLGHGDDLRARFGPMTVDKSSRIAILEDASLGVSTGTTIYPHLSLGPGQRLASKAGYVVRFAGVNGSDLVAESELIVP